MLKYATAAELLELPVAEEQRWLRSLSDKTAARLLANWSFWARPDQLPPPGNWHVWLMLAGRGFGKTRAGAEWVHAQALARPGARIALVAANPAEARSIMVEGTAGLLRVGLAEQRPCFESSLRTLTWPNGSVATLFGASDPDSLRGPELDFAWADEVGKWTGGSGVAAWDNLRLTLRRGTAPRLLATTTPRSGPLLRRIIAGEGVVVTRGATRDNLLHVDPGWIAAMERLYGGTRQGRQELEGELLDDAEGALWTRELIERCRVAADSIGKPARVVIGVDPPAGGGADGEAGGDACGIVVAALLRDGRLAVLEDASVASGQPAVWAQAVAMAAARWHADRIIAERNQGGAMVAATLRAADVALPVVDVWASRGKSARAEPIAIRYQRGEVVHAGSFPALEDELCGLLIGGGYAGPGRSPDRADACVWALAELGDAQRAGEAKVRLV